MDNDVYEEACRVTPSRVPSARRGPGPNPAAGTSEGVDGSAETSGQSGPSSSDPGSAPPSAADGTDAYIPGVGISGSGHAQVWTCIKRKAIPVLSIVLNCALLGTVIFLAVKMSDLKLSVSQLDHKTAADLANVSDWLEEAMGKIDGISEHIEELKEIPVTVSDLNLSVSQLGHKTAADLAHVSGWLQQAMDKAQELSERVDGNDKAVQDVAASVARLTASQQSVIQETEKKILQRLEKLGVTCPNGYKKYGEVCYKVFTTRKTFADAAATCQAEGGTLAMPRNAGINGFLGSLMEAARPRRQFSWFGLRKRENGQWEWMDGTALGTGFNAWAEDQPNNKGGIEDCAQYHGHGWNRWHDFPCHDKERFICQVLLKGM